MEKTSLVQNDAITETLLKYSDMIRRICFIYLRNQSELFQTFASRTMI